MGNFYGNVTLLGTSVEAATLVAVAPAFVAGDENAVVVFAEADDIEPTTGAALSEALGCKAFTTVVHDDDLLMMEIHDNGQRLVGCAVPDPEDVFGPGADVGELDPQPPAPATFVQALGRGDATAVQAALEQDFIFASDRHRALAEALDLPTYAVGWGFNYLSEDIDDFEGPEPVTID